MTKPTDPRASYIAIAAKRFAREGYHGTSLAALAKDAGVSKQALLHFYGKKETLYAEVLTDLATRLCHEIDSADAPEPAQHLLAHFLSFKDQALNDGQDVRLVVRALLDSNPTARKWPLKPYIDRLTALVAQTLGGRDMDEAARLAWVSQMIGMIQYLAISTPAVKGMYGAPLAKDVAARFDIMITRAVHDALALQSEQGKKS